LICIAAGITPIIWFEIYKFIKSRKRLV